MSTTTADVSAYAAQVRAALADLPAAERDDLLADLEDHLTEVAEEGPLTDLLGPPERYAAELRSSAGLPPAGRPAGRSRPAWLRETLAFLPELRPGWWVLRGLVFAVLVTAVLGGGLPLGLLVALAAVPGSVVLGRRAARDPGLRWLDIAASVLAAVLAVLSIGLVGGTNGGGGTAEYGVVAPEVGPEGRLVGVTNLYPYTADGKPLRDVQLYDQDGEPVELVAEYDAEGRPIGRVPRRTTDGRVARNVYPQEQTVAEEPAPDGTSRERVVRPPDVTAPPLAPR